MYSSGRAAGIQPRSRLRPRSHGQKDTAVRNTKGGSYGDIHRKTGERCNTRGAARRTQWVQLGRIRMDPDKFARGLGWFSIGLGGSRAAGYSRGFRHTESYSLLQRIKNGEIDPGFVVTHRMALNDAPQDYDIFLKKEDERVTIVLKP